MKRFAATAALALLLGCGGASSPPKSDPVPSDKKDGGGGGAKTDNNLDQKQRSKGADEFDLKEKPAETGKVQSSDEPVHKVELVALLGEYEKDEPAADRAYRTKLVEVRGTIETIEGSAAVLTAPGATLRCRCVFPGGFGDGATMNPGLEVRIQGRVKGRQGDVLLEECRLRQ